MKQPYIRKLRKSLRKAAPIFDLEHRGMKLRLYPAENVCDMKIAVFDDHPVHGEYSVAGDALRKATVFVDIGSNVGIYALFGRAIMPTNSRIIAFEPDPRTVRKLRQNLDFNDASSVTVINAAVGPEETVMKLYSASTKNAGRNTLKQSLAGDSEERGVDVRVRPLADMLIEEGVSHIDVLKIDVEGFEAAALVPFFKNADPTLWPSYVMIETVASAHWDVDLIALMRERGYETVHETSEDMHLRRYTGAGANKKSNP
jgi:FkbM family methyltransferase